LRAKLKPFAPPLILGLLALVFFWKILLTNLILVGVDVFLYFYPYKAYATESLLSGRFPLWNPHIFMGVPFLANSQAGLLYPLNWIFLWAEAPKQVAYSIGLHIWIAAVGAYLFARRGLNLGGTASLVGGGLFALSGYLGAQVEHVNQLQVSAWLPWVFLIFEMVVRQSASRQEPGRHILKGRLINLWQVRRYIALLGLVITLMLLAGHTQTIYISLFGLGLYGLFRPGVCWWPPGRLISSLLSNLMDLHPLIPAVLLAVLMSAAQLLPTLELARHSIRAGGLSYNEAVAFSLNPLKSWLTILPPYGVDLEAQLGPAFSEYIAYIGMVPLLLAALGALYLWRARTGPGLGLGVIGLTGFLLAFGVFTGPVYLALYFLMPGFKLFRVPARWLLLYAFAVSLFAAVGFGRLEDKRWRWVVLLLIPVELFIAAQSLRYNQPTAPEAFSFLRPAIVQLQAIQTPTDRFLSLSGIEYDPGDLKEMSYIFGDQLPERAIYDYVIAAKEKEVLFFNLPMVYGLNAIDGYDGGLLPLKRFIEWQKVFLPEDDLSLDGRLREKLQVVPPGRLLALARVRHIITDKVKDVWLDNIFYDLQFPAYLDPAGAPEIWTNDLPTFQASSIGVVFNTPYPSGSVAKLVVRYTSGQEAIFDLQADKGTPWENAEFGVDYNQVFDGLTGDPIKEIGLIAERSVIVRGVSLIQQATTTSRSIILSTGGNYRFIHGGDVKIYENLNSLPPAYIVRQMETVSNTNEAIALLQNPQFDLSTRIVRVGNPDTGPGTFSSSPVAPNEAVEEDQVQVINYTPEQIELQANLSAPGWLVLTDTLYPGWRAWINDTEVDIFEANLIFRAIEIPAGSHYVTLAFKPMSFYMGLGLSLVGIISFLILILSPQIDAKGDNTYNQPNSRT
jgi:hypothetical protein